MVIHMARYSTRTCRNALNRMAQAFAFLIPVPGPKMFCMFGELGYDYSISGQVRMAIHLHAHEQARSLGL